MNDGEGLMARNRKTAERKHKAKKEAKRGGREWTQVVRKGSVNSDNPVFGSAL